MLENSNSLIESSYIENKNLNRSLKNFYPDSFDFSHNSIIKSKFAEPFHFLCKRCKNIPILKFNPKNTIKFECDCKDLPKELSFKDIYNYLFYSNNFDIVDKMLKCRDHPNKKL